VTVAVIDSGICLDHPDLAGRIVSGWDFVQDDNQPQDEFGHGCGVAGIIAANVNNGIGVAGVAPNARLMPLRVLDGLGMGSSSDVAAAIVYAADSGAQIINLSLGGPTTSSLLEEAVNYAASRGVTIVASAGNQGVEAALYPAAYPAAIAVGSVDQSLQRSSFSNYGWQLDLMAPGRDIFTTDINGDYTTMTGTSFAAPEVAGAAALMMAFNQALPTGGGLLTLNPPPPACG
jgi:thermitase